MDVQNLTADATDTLTIVLHHGEVVRIGPCVSLHLIRPRTRETNAQVATALEAFLDLAGETVTFLKEGADWPKPTTAAELAALPDRVREMPVAQPMSLRLHGGENRDDAHPVYFSALLPASWDPQPSGFVTTGLSMARFMDQNVSFKGWAQRLCDMLEPTHGSGGFGLLTNPEWGLSSDVLGQVAAILERFSGLDYPAVPSGGFVTRDGPVAANWLTMLNGDLVKKLGGARTVQESMEALGGQALVCTSGLMLVAPGAPQIGGAEDNPTPKGYKSVGGLISAVLGNKEAGYFMDATDRDMLAFSKAWRLRFG